MSRLIDADALKATMIETLEQIKANPKMNGQEMHIIAGIAMLGEMIDDSPTIDAVPVVRCRECKHYREALSQTSDNAVVVWCAADKYPHNDVMPDDWYCAAGEREEGDNE